MEPPVRQASQPSPIVKTVSQSARSLTPNRCSARRLPAVAECLPQSFVVRAVSLLSVTPPEQQADAARGAAYR
jgi:hypothetical protein